MAGKTCGSGFRRFGRALLALILAGCGQALAGPDPEWVPPARIGAMSVPMPPVVIAGVPAAPPAARAPLSKGLDPISTAAITRSVFGSYAIPIRNFPVAGRWAGVFREIEACAAGAAACGSDAETFGEIAGRLEGASFVDKLRAVNSRVNQAIRYANDRSVWGRFDHWASPGEVLARRTGDCEDFVILKMAALLSAGVPARSMSLVVLKIRGKNVFHAVLAVSTSSGAFILDNVTDRVLSDSSIRDYMPLYSLSADRAWLHGTATTGTRVARSDLSFGAIAPGEGLVP
jgi:predicted transglutaminase-like cysteine proteinase